MKQSSLGREIQPSRSEIGYANLCNVPLFEDIFLECVHRTSFSPSSNCNCWKLRLVRNEKQ